GRVDLRMVVKIEPVGLAQIFRFVDPQNHRFGEAVECAEQMTRRDVVEIPRSDGALDRLQQRILADALGAAKHERMVDLLLRALYPLRQPVNDVHGVVRENLVHMFEPTLGFARIAELEPRLAIEIETGDTALLDPAAVRDQTVAYQHGLARAPCALRQCPVSIEPTGGRYGLRLTVGVQYRFPVLVDERHRLEHRVDAHGRPRLAGWGIGIRVHGQVGPGVVERDAGLLPALAVFAGPLSLGAGIPGLLAEIVVVAHGTRSGNGETMSLKSLPSGGMSNATGRPARFQCCAHCSALAWPTVS